MKRYELGISKGYVSDWTVQDALREFVQNGIDQEIAVEGNDFSVNYNPETEEMRLKNKKSILNRSTLLLGCTTKADDTETIGKFGEGYKLAVLVLLRNGYEVTIENYGVKELWKFKFSKLRKYNNVESLVVDIDTKHIWQKVPDDDLTIVIKGVTEADYAEYKERRIPEDAEIIVTNYGNILLDKSQKGRIYVRGLYVTTKTDYRYGYDFMPEFIKIGRDRNLVDSWDISAITRKMWLESEDYDRVIDMVEESAPDIEHIKYTWDTSIYNQRASANNHNYVNPQKKTADRMWEAIRKKNGDVLIAKSEDERVIKENRFKAKTIVVSPLIYETITQNSDDYSEYEDSVEANIQKTEVSLADKIWNWAYEYDISSDAINALLDIFAKYQFVINLEGEEQ